MLRCCNVAPTLLQRCVAYLRRPPRGTLNFGRRGSTFRRTLQTPKLGKAYQFLRDARPQSTSRLSLTNLVYSSLCFVFPPELIQGEKWFWSHHNGSVPAVVAGHGE